MRKAVISRSAEHGDDYCRLASACRGAQKPVTHK
jgi:hypothetical protein